MVLYSGLISGHHGVIVALISGQLGIRSDWCYSGLISGQLGVIVA